jgi:hypothetical protein
VRRGRKILLTIDENKKCSSPVYCNVLMLIKYDYFNAFVYVMLVSLGKRILAPPIAY